MGIGSIGSGKNYVNDEVSQYLMEMTMSPDQLKRHESIRQSKLLINKIKQKKQINASSNNYDKKKKENKKDSGD